MTNLNNNASWLDPNTVYLASANNIFGGVYNEYSAAKFLELFDRQIAEFYETPKPQESKAAANWLFKNKFLKFNSDKMIIRTVKLEATSPFYFKCRVGNILKSKYILNKSGF